MSWSQNGKKINFRFIVSFIAAWTLLLMFISIKLIEDNSIYAIGEIRAYNPDVFNGNVYLGGGVSPRYIIDMVFGLLMHLNGGKWAEAALVWIYFGAFIQALGIANIAYRISRKHQIVIAAIFTCLIAYCGNYLAGFSLIFPASISIGVALAFSFLSISFLMGETRNYKMAWLFAGCAIICHVHEGIYCCVVIFLFVFVDCVIQKRVLLKENNTVIIAVIALLAAVVPSMITDTMDISNADFVYIYSIFRHPHHLVPSTWGLDSIYKTIWIDTCLLLLCIAAKRKCNMGITKYYLYEAGALLGAWITAILLMYVFTEIKPVAFISTLFLSKSFKYVLLIALIWIVEASFDLRERGDYISGYLLIFFAFSASGYELKQICLIALLIFVVMQVEDYFVTQELSFLPDKIIPSADFLFFVYLICIKQEILLKQRKTIILVFIAIMVIGYAMKRKFKGYKFLCVAASVCMIALSLLGRVVLHDNAAISLINEEKVLRATLGDDLFSLAEQFRTATDERVEFLADPNDTTNVGWFQVVSQRNCYVVQKVIPSSKSTIDDWYERYKKVNAFNEKNVEEIETIMHSEGLKYILIKADNYYKFDETGDYSIFLSSPSDSFRIYKLN